MTDQNDPTSEHSIDEAPAPEQLPASPDELNRRQHLAAALRGRPLLIAATAGAALAVGFGGFGVGYAVGNDDEHGDRIGRAVFERGGPGGWPGQFGPDNG